MSSETSAYQSSQNSGLSPGMLVGRYRLLSLIASGGMAQVWAAEPESTVGISRTVALKVIRPEFAQDLEYARMFIDEATIATAVRHPNVCETFELARHQNVLFMAMELVAGDSLGGLLRSGDRFLPLSCPIVAKICADACAGVHAAHEATDAEGRSLGVIHRDISPPNLLVSLQGQVKVSDFGVAKARHQLHERTKTGEIKGKFAYLAPEQIGGGRLDRRADVYAMGCVLYTATVGLRPFGNGVEAMSKILAGRYKAPSELMPNYPPALEEIVVRALSSSPEDRFDDADEMREALEQWLWSNRTLVSQADIANVVRERMAPEAQRVAQQYLVRSRSSSQDVYRRLLESVDENEPPTAGSGVVVPANLRMKVAFPPRIPFAGEADTTQIIRTEPVVGVVSLQREEPDGVADSAPTIPLRPKVLASPPKAEPSGPKSARAPAVVRPAPTDPRLVIAWTGVVSLVISSVVWFLLR